MNYAIIAEKPMIADKKGRISVFKLNSVHIMHGILHIYSKILTSKHTLYIILKYCKKEVPIWQKCGQALPTVLPTV